MRPALALAWGLADSPRRGPRPSLTLDAIVAATVELADADGIEAVSMQRVAARVGVTTMALYRYVATKDDLVFLAVDAAAGEPPPGPAPGEGLAVGHRALGPRSAGVAAPASVGCARSDQGAADRPQPGRLDGALPRVHRAQRPARRSISSVCLNLLSGFVLGHFRLYDELARGAAAGGLSLEGAQQRYAELIRTMIEPTRFPRTAAAFAAIADLATTDAVREDFEFGLATLLDGIEAMLPHRAGPPRRSLLHPRIVRGVGIHGRATTIDRLGAQFVVPGLVAVDLAQPVLGAVLRQPRRGIEGPDVDRVPGHVSGRVRGGDPSGSFLFRAVLGDRLAKKLILVLRGAPSAVDVELDAVVSGIRRRFAQGLEQIGVEVGYAGILVIKHRHAVGEGTVILGDGTVSLGSRTTVVAAKDFAERGRR